MIKDRAKDVLINMGMPASLKGLDYIVGIIELFDSGHQKDKITSLYTDIGKKDNSSGSRVERAIRHAFEVVIAKGRLDAIEKYLSFDNTTNSNMLKLLYYRLKQEECTVAENNTQKAEEIFKESSDPYQDLEDNMILAVQRFIKELREVNSNACSKVG